MTVVVIPSPGFPANAALAQSLGIETRSYGIRAETGFTIDLDEIRTLVDRRTEVVLVNTPHNPTGAVIGDRELEDGSIIRLEKENQLPQNGDVVSSLTLPATAGNQPLPSTVAIARE